MRASHGELTLKMRTVTRTSVVKATEQRILMDNFC